MDEPAIRQLVRQVIAQHLGQAQIAAEIAPPASPAILVRQHPSQLLFQLARAADSGDGCLIEPTVRCSHCGFCKSYGH